VNFGSLEDALMAVRELLSKSVMHPVSNVSRFSKTDIAIWYVTQYRDPATVVKLPNTPHSEQEQRMYVFHSSRQR